MPLIRLYRSNVGITLVALAMLATACSGGSVSSESTGSTLAVAKTSSTTTAATIAITTSTVAEIVGGSIEIRDLDHPLMADLVISTDLPLAPSVKLIGPPGTPQVQVPPPPLPDTDHVILLAGMRANTTYTVETELLDASGEVVGRLKDQSLTTGPLPIDIPTLRVATSRADSMESGLTLFNLVDIRNDLSTAADDGSIPPPGGWLLMIDSDGQIVWYHNENLPLGDARMLDDGTILFEYNDTSARRINLRGEILEEWAGNIISGRLATDAFGRQVLGDSPVIVDVDSMHHEHMILPDGSHATISTELRVLDGFDEPQCGEDPADFDGTYHLVGDVIVIFDPDTGEVLDEFNLFDYFDPRDDPSAYNLCGLPFDFVFPNWLYRGIDALARDWTHTNGIEVDEANNALIVSVRHLDALIALKWKDDANGQAGDLLWHSGPLGDMTLTNGIWHRFQHAPELEPDGTILLYDNGNNRPGYGTTEAPLFSRAARFAIDPEAGTVEQTWEYRSTIDGQPVFTPFVGDADLLNNGDVLITFGGINGGIDGLSAQILEVVPSQPEGGEVLFDLRVEGGAGWIVYRAERIPSVYG